MIFIDRSAPPRPIIKIGSPTIKESVHHWMQEFEKRAGDRFDVKVFPLSQLGSIPRMLEGTHFGTVEMVLIPPADKAEFAAFAEGGSTQPGRCFKDYPCELFDANEPGDPVGLIPNVAGVGLAPTDVEVTATDTNGSGDVDTSITASASAARPRASPTTRAPRATSATVQPSSTT